MDKDTRKRLFDLLLKIDDLTDIAREMPGCDGSVTATLTMDRGSVTQEKKNAAGGTGPNHDSTRRYSPAFKKMIVHLHKNEGRSCSSITDEYGVSKATITKWCADSRYENTVKLSETSRALEDVRAENEKIKEENTFLKRIMVLLFGMGIGGTE